MQEDDALETSAGDSSDPIPEGENSLGEDDWATDVEGWSDTSDEEVSVLSDANASTNDVLDPMVSEENLTSDIDTNLFSEDFLETSQKLQGQLLLPMKMSILILCLIPGPCMSQICLTLRQIFLRPKPNHQQHKVLLR